MGSFTSPGLDTSQKGPTIFSVLSEKTRAITGSVLPGNTSARHGSAGIRTHDSRIGRPTRYLPLRHGAPAGGATQPVSVSMGAAHPVSVSVGAAHPVSVSVGV